MHLMDGLFKSCSSSQHYFTSTTSRFPFPTFQSPSSSFFFFFFFLSQTMLENFIMIYKYPSLNNWSTFLFVFIFYFLLCFFFFFFRCTELHNPLQRRCSRRRSPHQSRCKTSKPPANSLLISPKAALSCMISLKMKTQSVWSVPKLCVSQIWLLLPQVFKYLIALYVTTQLFEFFIIFHIYNHLYFSLLYILTFSSRWSA